jgi:uncharacterized protein
VLAETDPSDFPRAQTGESPRCARGNLTAWASSTASESYVVWQAGEVELTAEQARVLACLIEKGATTPDSYPMTSNALTNACNQTTSRDPVVRYSERDVDEVMLQLRELKLARTVTGSGHRVGKHKHIVDEARGLDGRELAVVAVLMLRGPQTINEIASRTERYAGGPDGDVEVVNAAIDHLAGRDVPLVDRLSRQPGEREARIVEVWSEGADESGASARSPSPSSPNHDGDNSAARIAALESALGEQTRRIDHLFRELGLDTPD